MAKANSNGSFIIKSKSTFKGEGWNGKKVKPFKQPQPSKTFDPYKSGDIIIK